MGQIAQESFLDECQLELPGLRQLIERVRQVRAVQSKDRDNVIDQALMEYWWWLARQVGQARRPDERERRAAAAQIGRRRAIDYGRRHGAAERPRVSESEPSSQLNPLDGATLKMEVLRALSELRASERGLILLQTRQSWTHAEMARHFALGAGAMKTKLSRAWGSFREALRLDSGSLDTKTLSRAIAALVSRLTESEIKALEAAKGAGHGR